MKTPTKATERLYELITVHVMHPYECKQRITSLIFELQESRETDANIEGHIQELREINLSTHTDTVVEQNCADAMSVLYGHDDNSALAGATDGTDLECLDTNNLWIDKLVAVCNQADSTMASRDGYIEQLHKSGLSLVKIAEHTGLSVLQLEFLLRRFKRDTRKQPLSVWRDRLK